MIGPLITDRITSSSRQLPLNPIGDQRLAGDDGIMPAFFPNLVSTTAWRLCDERT